MADKLDALRAVVIGDPGFAALAADRFFAKGGRQGAAYPYAVFDVITTDHAVHLEGTGDLEAPLVQIECYGRNADEARGLRAAVTAALDGPEVEGAGIRFSAVIQSKRGPAPDEETRTQRADVDYKLW